jgi:hypothetical protein
MGDNVKKRFTSLTLLSISAFFSFALILLSSIYPTAMDPLTAVGLAGTVVQFVDFSSKIVIGAKELYKHGELKLNAQAAAVARDLLDFCTKLQLSSQNYDGSEAPTENDLALIKLCGGCKDVAKELLAKLDLLKPELDVPEPPHRDHPQYETKWKL